MTVTLDHVVDKVRTLPQLPDVTVRMIQVINDPASTLTQIVDIIRYDQTVTAELLRLCNSAYMALSDPVQSVDDAVRLLGTATVLQLLMSAHTQALLTPAQAGYGLPPGGLWTHSVAAALASRSLARRVGLPQPGVAFTIGLLHDMGKVVLNEYVAAEFARIAEHVATHHTAFHEAEASVLGFTHAEVGALAAERWKLPQPIIDGIRYHYAPTDAPSPDGLIDVAHVADTACTLLGIGGGDDGLYYRADSDAVSRLGLSAVDIERLGQEVVPELKNVQRMIGVSAA
ncbi:MAG: HDOD domain-containing protein [Phycisphaerae bacterium]|jgi:putative nucleotidyltransferase with HDIG domain|nr:HDOD domain-containing protein [Phycisphaerae bacterium]MCZ2399537.1 HDOD domain-containing protein [Phycisphaerae bacterium]